MTSHPATDLPRSNLTAALDEWVGEQLACYEYRFGLRVRDKKLIRDGLWDSHLFAPYEIHILDCPIVQRLRQVSQTALTSQVYPSATHTRFQHTLGTVIVLDHLLDAIEKQSRSLSPLNGGDYLDLVQPYLRELRVAALLHDVGHGIFSHTSETYYGGDADIQQAIIDLGLPDGTKPHEVLGYVIVTRPAFREFIAKVMDLYGQPELNLDLAADLIVGRGRSGPQGYLRDLINGVFDVDKLDYISRDAHTTGVKMVIDLDRLAYTTSVESMATLRGAKYEDMRKLDQMRLVVSISGVPAVEQIVFNKLLLRTSVYDHHKVRATNCMLHGLFNLINELPADAAGLVLKSPLDFLQAEESVCLNDFGKTGEVADYMRTISGRKLLKRALVISRKTLGLRTEEDLDGFMEVLDEIQGDKNKLTELRMLLFSKAESQGLAGGYGPEYFWFDFPDVPRFREPSQCLIKQADGELRFLNEIFRIDSWAEAYFDNKWRGHIFCPPDLERDAIGRLGAEALGEMYGLEVNAEGTAQAKCFAQ